MEAGHVAIGELPWLLLVRMWRWLVLMLLLLLRPAKAIQVFKDSRVQSIRILVGAPKLKGEEEGED